MERLLRETRGPAGAKTLQMEWQKFSIVKDRGS